MIQIILRYIRQRQLHDELPPFQYHSDHGKLNSPFIQQSWYDNKHNVIKELNFILVPFIIQQLKVIWYSHYYRKHMPDLWRNFSLRCRISTCCEFAMDSNSRKSTAVKRWTPWLSTNLVTKHSSYKD